MLLEFECSNHKSIRNKIIFSALAGSDKTYEERNYSYGKNSVLRSAVIYGANGSGKSTLINAINFVKYLVLNSLQYQPGQGLPQTPHKLEGCKKESTYKIQFITNNVRYVYGFSLKNFLVLDEYLYYFPNGRKSCIFERNDIGFKSGSKFRGRFSSCKDVLKPNRLMLSCAANFTSLREIEMAYKFFSDELVIYDPNKKNNWMQYSLYQISKNRDLKNTVVNFMKDLGINLKDINIKIDNRYIDESNISKMPSFLSDDFKQSLLNKNYDAVSAEVVYSEFKTDLFGEESSGVQKLFGILCPLIDIMDKGKVLICDELEASLHESIVYEILNGLMKMNVKKGTGPQIFFTTHETSLLNLDLFRRDQIWFTELNENGRETKLYSLAEFKKIRKDDNFRKGYISGQYGAIPKLNIDFSRNTSNV